MAVVVIEVQLEGVTDSSQDTPEPYISMATKLSGFLVLIVFVAPKEAKEIIKTGMNTMKVILADATPLKPFFPSAEKVMSSAPMGPLDWSSCQKGSESIPPSKGS